MKKYLCIYDSLFTETKIKFVYVNDREYNTDLVARDLFINSIEKEAGVCVDEMNDVYITEITDINLNNLEVIKESGINE